MEHNDYESTIDSIFNNASNHSTDYDEKIDVTLSSSSSNTNSDKEINTTMCADEEIDTTVYTKDTTYLIILDQNMYDIVNNKNKCTLLQKHLSDAFGFIKSNKLHDFREIISNHKFIINSKYHKTYLIHEACRIGNPEYVSLLLFLGAKCNMLDDNGLMAQHYAVISKQTIIVDIISLFGNSMNVTDMQGDTLLYYATKDKNIEMIKTLMVYKTDPRIKNISSIAARYYFSTNDSLVDLMNGYIDKF